MNDFHDILVRRREETALSRHQDACALAVQLVERMCDQVGREDAFSAAFGSLKNRMEVDRQFMGLKSVQNIGGGETITWETEEHFERAMSVTLALPALGGDEVEIRLQTDLNPYDIDTEALCQVRTGDISVIDTLVTGIAGEIAIILVDVEDEFGVEHPRP